jgi:hypothetical protein
MSYGPAHVQFWARLTFVNEHAENYVKSHDDLSKAPWRPEFYYKDENRQTYMIWPIAREGDEFG